MNKQKFFKNLWIVLDLIVLLIFIQGFIWLQGGLIFTMTDEASSTWFFLLTVGLMSLIIVGIILRLRK